MKLILRPMHDRKGDHIQVQEMDKDEILTNIVAAIYDNGTITIHHMNNWKIEDLQSLMEIARNYQYIHPNLKQDKRL